MIFEHRPLGVDPVIHMVDFQNIFSQNGVFIAIPWGSASKSPLIPTTLKPQKIQYKGILTAKIGRGV